MAISIKNQRYCKKMMSERNCNLDMADIERIWDAFYDETPNMMAYAVLLSIETGMRASEVVALRWDDIEDDRIYVHRHQMLAMDEGGELLHYVEVPYREVDHQDARAGYYIPVTPSIRALLDLIQESTPVPCDYVISNDGHWITKSSYERYLTRHTMSLGYYITGNHVFRTAYDDFLS